MSVSKLGNDAMIQVLPHSEKRKGSSFVLNCASVKAAFRTPRWEVLHKTVFIGL